MLTNLGIPGTIITVLVLIGLVSLFRKWFRGKSIK